MTPNVTDYVSGSKGCRLPEWTGELELSGRPNPFGHSAKKVTFQITNFVIFESVDFDSVRQPKARRSKLTFSTEAECQKIQVRLTTLLELYGVGK